VMVPYVGRPGAGDAARRHRHVELLQVEVMIENILPEEQA
jgi:hypothetical protein